MTQEVVTVVTRRLTFVVSVLFVVIVVFAAAAGTTSAENIDAAGVEVDRFCFPEALRDSRRSCECSSISASPWGMRALHVDCSYKDFKTTEVEQPLLPLYINTLDLSWNALDYAPTYISDSLHQLNLMHNNISRLTGRNFAKLSGLRQLYLSWNSIQVVDTQAFADLPQLQILDLAHNNLISLPAQIFAPLLVLSTLDLSWNRHLNETAALQTANSDFYGTFGINKDLSVLLLEACSLNKLVLPTTVTLKQLSLRRNHFTRIPTHLPPTLQNFDISANQLEALLPLDTVNLTQLRKLYVEDMPRLQTIAAHALAPLQQLEFASFQNSRQLSSIDPLAFHANISSQVERKSTSHLGPAALQVLLFRGTLLRHFNATLSPVFAQLTKLDLNGVPLYCDCELVWLKDLGIQTNGRCYRPSKVRGMLVSSVRREAFSCDYWPRWAYGLIILGLIVLCAGGVYLLVMGLRPHRGVTMRRKVGSGSPYARVTIEPNRQENNFH